MPNLLFIAGFLTLTLWACCLQAQTVAAEDEAMVRSEIDALMGEMTASAEKLSTAALQKYLSDDPQDSFFLGTRSFPRLNCWPNCKNSTNPMPASLSRSSNPVSGS